MRIEGKCHCGNITYELEWPGDGTSIPVRVCNCSFCVKHGGNFTSHGDAKLTAVLHDESQVTRYKFGTETAEFHICARCGVVPLITSTIEGRLYGVVNVNCFEGIDRSCLSRAVADFHGETTESRLARRQRNWIPSVTISAP